MANTNRYTKEQIKDAITKAGGFISIACKSLSCTRKTIYNYLDKYPELGAEPGNGTRIGSAPVEFEYSNTKTRSNPVNDTDDYMRTDLTFFLEHRRSIIITPLGIDVRDT